MFLEKIKEFILKNKKTILIITLFFLFFIPDISFAADAIKKDWGGFMKIINAILAWIALFLWLITQFISWFMSPEWTNGQFIWIDTNLKTLWIMVSNIVYTIFAILLIWIAFMNVLWKWWDWELKQALPKFIGWVLIVPFSWFIVNAILSISAILMTSMITLPYESFPKDFAVANDIELCSHIIVRTWKLDIEEAVKCKDWAKTTIAAIFKNWQSLWSIIWIYTYWILRVNIDWKFYTWDLKTVKNIMELWIKWVIDLLVVLVFFVLMIALMLALFIRWVYIWIFLVISPLFGLMFFFWDDKMWESLKKFSLKEFISLALMPVYVWAALSFWLLFILVAWSWLSWKQEWDTIIKDNKVKFWEFTFEFQGAIGWSSDETVQPMIEALIWTKNAIWYLIIQLLWIAVLWIAVIAALNKSSLTREIVKPFESFWQSIGSLAMKAPTYAPILPGGMSAQGLSTFWSNVNQHYLSKAQKSWSDLSSGIFGELNSWRKAAETMKRDYSSTLWSNKKKDIIDKTLPELRKASTKEDFEYLIKVMVEKGILKESAIKNDKIKYGVDITTMWKALYTEMKSDVQSIYGRRDNNVINSINSNNTAASNPSDSAIPTLPEGVTKNTSNKELLVKNDSYNVKINTSDDWKVDFSTNTLKDLAKIITKSKNSEDLYNYIASNNNDSSKIKELKKLFKETSWNDAYEELIN